MPNSLNLIHDVRGSGRSGLQLGQKHYPTNDLIEYVGTKFGTAAYEYYNSATYANGQRPLMYCFIKTGSGTNVYINRDDDLYDNSTDVSGSIYTPASDLSLQGELKWGFNNIEDYFIYQGRVVRYCFKLAINRIHLTCYANIANTIEFALYGWSYDQIQPKLLSKFQIFVGTATTQVCQLWLNSQNKYFDMYSLRGVSQGTNCAISLQQLELFGSLQEINF